MCTGLRVTSPSRLFCLAPAGTGTQPIFIASNDFLSPPATLGLTYAAPTIQWLSGCGQSSKSAQLTACVASQAITVYGANFGLNGTRVYMGSYQCMSVSQQEFPFHDTLTCQLPTILESDLAVPLSVSVVNNVNQWFAFFFFCLLRYSTLLASLSHCTVCVLGLTLPLRCCIARRASCPRRIRLAHVLEDFNNSPVEYAPRAVLVIGRLRMGLVSLAVPAGSPLEGLPRVESVSRALIRT